MFLMMDHKKIHDRIEELRKMKHLPLSAIMLVKWFKSYRSLKLVSQNSVGKKLVFRTVFNAYSTINISSISLQNSLI